MTDTNKSVFNLLDAERDQATRKTLLATRDIPSSLGSLEKGAEFYHPDPDLLEAVNVALTVGAPLLLTGEPGTGKTQLAYYLASFFGIELFPLFVKSTTTASDLQYRFDTVAYLHAAQDPKQDIDDMNNFIRQGPLWKAFEQSDPSVVLLDEIDKASRDFPNDLLNVLDQHTFRVDELDDDISRKDAPPPIVIITSNSERRLPEAFLRRCIFHYITFSDDLVRKAVEARIGDFPNLSVEIRDAATTRFLELRSVELRKRPATAELLVWLTALSAMQYTDLNHISHCPLSDLPALNTLIKDRDDYEILG
ncbi:MAG: MoxR family ATPase [Magnetococcales bacterium]|nr:MoxR family ATPase [Magnetococcales bacterium]